MFITGLVSERQIAPIFHVVLVDHCIMISVVHFAVKDIQYTEVSFKVSKMHCIIYFTDMFTYG